MSLFEKKEAEVPSKPTYQTVEDYEKSGVEQPSPVDQTLLISDLSHQLEEARNEIESLKLERRELKGEVIRLTGAREALKELVLELHGR